VIKLSNIYIINLAKRHLGVNRKNFRKKVAAHCLHFLPREAGMALIKSTLPHPRGGMGTYPLESAAGKVFPLFPKTTNFKNFKIQNS